MRFKINPKNKRKQFKIFISRAEENLKEANILLREKGYRGAISRAYYSFFETAHAVLITKGITAKTHAGLITLFGLHFVKTNEVPVKFARFFRKAKESREEADYEFLKRFSKKDAEEVIQKAEEFVDYIKKMIKRSKIG